MYINAPETTRWDEGYLNFIPNLVGYISHKGTRKYKETEGLMSSFILLLLSTMYDSDTKIRDDKKLKYNWCELHMNGCYMDISFTIRH